MNVLTIKRPQAAESEEKISVELQFSQYLRASGRYCADGGIIRRWTGNFWQALTGKEAERVAFEWVASMSPAKATAKMAASCVDSSVISIQPLPRVDVSTTEVLIPCQNGYLRLSEGADGMWHRELVKPDKNQGITYEINCDYQPGAAAHEFDRFIKGVLPDEEVREFVREYLGYTLLPDCRFQTAQIWFGSGANGKSKLSEIIGELHKKTIALELDNLDGFRLEPLIGASLVRVDEIPKRINEQKLKSLISAGQQSVDRKYRAAVSFIPTAKWLINCNSIPAVSDQSNGFWRRFEIIPFTQSFLQNGDPLIAERIIKNELSGVLNWVLAGLVRLLERGEFLKTPDAVAAAKNEGKRETNSVASWLGDDDIELSYSAQTPREDVVARYRLWCQQNGMGAVSTPRFWQRMREMLGEDFSANSRVRVDGKQIRVVPIKLPPSPASPNRFSDAQNQ